VEAAVFAKGVMKNVISFRDVIDGILIGAANQSWLTVFLSSVGWAFVAWLFILL
jgi:hypothetical protein